MRRLILWLMSCSLVYMSLCGLTSCETNSGNDEKDSLLVMAIMGSGNPVMEFTVDDDTMSWPDCTYAKVKLSGFGIIIANVTGQDSAGNKMVLYCGDGSPGLHNGSTLDSNESVKYTMEGDVYYGHVEYGGFSSITIIEAGEDFMEGIFSATACNSIGECLNIEDGSFYAVYKK